MRLTHLDVFGFKSFLDKTEIPFGPGISGIVGPNGCGKSNIVEAIRWVLGEQRAGAVRGHRMEDVIFAGTRGRKPLGMCEVSLTIDNAEQGLAIDYSEVTITRRLFRSGDSDYLLNKVPCRLLDIQNLLMDTGLGPGAYSVMEQGMVDEIVDDRTENRRRILEEAAGITKYKARRRSTWSKLESTRADLQRIEDVVGEIKRNVDLLGRQVGRARRYQELKAELDDLDVRHGRHEFFSLQERLQPLQQEFDELSRTVEAGLTRFTGLEAELETERLGLTESEGALQEAGRRLSQCQEEIHALDTHLVSSREQRKARDESMQRAAGQREESRRQLGETGARLDETRSSLERSEAEASGMADRLRSQKERTGAADEEFDSVRAGLEGENRRLRELLREKSEGSESMARLRSERQGLEQMAEHLRAEAAEDDDGLNQARGSVAAAESLLETRRGRITAVSAALDSAARRGSEAESAVSARGGPLADLRREIESGRARLQGLERLRSGYEGYAGGVRALLVDSPCSGLFEGVLGDLIEVEPGLERAVETALGDAVEALVARGDEGLLEALEYLRGRSGRAGIYPLSWQDAPAEPAMDPSGVDGVSGPLAERVRAGDHLAPLLNRLLHNTFVVDDLPTAVAIARRHRGLPLRLVTAGGEGIGTDGRLAGGAEAPEEGLLHRRREIAELRFALSRRQARLAAAEALAAAQVRRCGILDARVEALTRGLEDEGRAEAGERLQLRSAREEQDRLRARREQQQARLAATEGKLQGLAGRAPREEARLAAIEEEISELEGRIQAGEERLKAAEGARREQQEALNGLRLESVRIDAEARGLRDECGRLEGLRKGHQTSIERLQDEVSRADRERARLGAEEEAITTQLAVRHQEREGLEGERQERHRQWQDRTTGARGLEEEIGRLQRELGADQERRHRQELQLAEMKAECRRIEGRLNEEYEVAVASLGPLDETDFDAAAAAERLERIRRSIARLGSVDVGVLQDYEEQKERYDFLCRQRDDLESAAEDLRKALQRIDRVARSKFRETFGEIREKFRETFARFFPGGEADLSLEADVDPLESNIEITARPRGKRLQSIGLLSGGERALTAISLLFAIYLVKPSPWCILDEVDAPLDDANTERFLRVLREFARTTQFILVTHNKLSMASADSLHGVTMPEEGVSQLVSVQVVEEMLEAAG
ncbi:MAG: chromosome segregation protein SMC [Gemmatimonadaceae bacterium]|nr:chromosome segregation protein SMC [Gemmatimonadaceae bacterium]